MPYRPSSRAVGTVSGGSASRRYHAASITSAPSTVSGGSGPTRASKTQSTHPPPAGTSALAPAPARAVASDRTVDERDQAVGHLGRRQPAIGHGDEQRTDVGIAEIRCEITQGPLVRETPTLLVKRQADRRPAEPHALLDCRD